MNKGHKLLAAEKENGSYDCFFLVQKAEVAYLKAKHPGKVVEISLHDWLNNWKEE